MGQQTAILTEQGFISGTGLGDTPLTEQKEDKKDKNDDDD